MDFLSKIGIGAKMGQAIQHDQTAILIETRLSGRLKELQLNNFQDYLRLLKRPDETEELHILLDSITVNETSFFRNPPQIKAFEEVIFPQVVEQARQKGLSAIRILSAGCSVLQQAVQGRFSKFSIRNVPDEYLNEFFKPVGTNFQIDDRIRGMVKFFKGNISDAEQMNKLGKFSIIFCRNVLIYFDQESKKKTLQNFYSMLHPQGYLFIGHSESLHGISQAFKLILLNKAIVYQHP